MPLPYADDGGGGCGCGGGGIGDGRWRGGARRGRRALGWLGGSEEDREESEEGPSWDQMRWAPWNGPSITDVWAILPCGATCQWVMRDSGEATARDADRVSARQIGRSGSPGLLVQARIWNAFVYYFGLWPIYIGLP
uniref:Uncharacterized protein n=1 Tax=Oryza sativa subsp. japonica TaxID=39947 RepID=Q6F398_ORYSJ|nr:hypothetical protein [Oryza sativa Japonica Group]